MKKGYGLALIAGMMVLLNGCWMQNSDELLMAPQQPTEYLTLQKKLDGILATGAEYTAPQSGQHRNTVQLEDLDNDGEEEAISFFQISSEGQFQVYVHKKIGEDYVQMGVITGHGTAIDSVSYPKIGKNGRRGIAIGWMLGSDLSKGITVCDFTEAGTVVPMLDTDYRHYTLLDFDGDGSDELLTFQGNGKVRGNMTARLFHYNGESMSMVSELALSRESAEIAKVTQGKVEGGQKAVFVDCKPGDGAGLVTNVLVCNEMSLLNLTVDVENNSAMRTYRMVSVNVNDVDGDGALEIPLASLLPGYSAERVSEALWLLEWHNVGMGEEYGVSVTTYQNSSEEWMFCIPEQWMEQVTVQRVQEGEAHTEFAVYRPSDENIPLLEIYVFAGDDRVSQASRPGFIKLAENATSMYAARIPERAYESNLALTEQEIRSLFSVIQRKLME